MQPINLTLQAFGPFANQQVIDFTAMGNAPLFLINGPTGSGKSAILDAICYALYGETTGSERTGDQMRCDYADVSLLTEVSFEFKLGAVSYKVVRSPEQEVPKKRGDGTTERKHSATLYRLNTDEEQLIANKPIPVLKEIRELIGLDVKQFRQVMVLPQGKFRELLTATSKEREQIFGQLFQTHIYTAIERALFDQAAGIRKAKDEFDNQIKGVLDVANVDSEKQLEQNLNEVTDRLSESKQRLDLSKSVLDKATLEEKASQELKQKFSHLAQKKQQLNDHLNEENHVKQLRGQRDNASFALSMAVCHSQFKGNHKALSDNLAELEQSSVALALAKETLSKSEANLKQAQLAQAGLAEIQNQIFNLDSVRSKLVERSEFEIKLIEAQRSCVSAEIKRDELQTEMARLEVQIASKRIDLDNAKHNQQQLPILQQQLDTLIEQRTLEQKKWRLERQQKTQFEHQDKLEAKLTAAKEQTENAIAYADNLEYLWHSSQAAQLAKHLNIDEPCPVCGSVEHPKLAVFTHDEVTKKNVDIARGHQKEVAKIEQKCLDDLAQCGKEIAITEQAILGINDQLLARPSLTAEETDKTIAQLEHKIAEIKQVRIESVESSLREIEQALLEVKTNLSTQLEYVNIAQVSMARIQTEVDSRTENMPQEFGDLVSVDAKLRSLNAEIARVVNQEKIARSHFDQSQQSFVSAQAKNQELEKQKALLIVARTQTDEQWNTALTDSPFSTEAHYIESALSKSAIDALELRISQFEQTKTALTTELIAIEASLADKVLPDVDHLIQQREAAELEHDDLSQQHTLLQSTQHRYHEVQKKLKLLKQQNEELNKQYEVVGTLSDVANGKTGSKISLHRFVLGVLLDDVLIQASLRLRKMSKGRYELKRKTQRTKGNAGSGLDLLVEDGYTSKMRDVATLSGGESFMAALALALGLSDVVQSYSGGIRLDTLFIDEGFGSLDPESLDLAIETLIDLQQGGRTIGIISHVSELKEQMTLRIDVEPSRTGSVVRVIH
ncbi:hypothetical protein A1QO_13555 [Vibrio genomosp. F10 str. ZF-129]|uniref:Nuclease SbcCD subunit C n=1 Tax=Vibrio genomosp. F10 str. ZF-129 TaxID=1187848 RepID=A0A1E5BB70_9VIBR|nr:SMC family ATPase [Vibrio genomosp. F10]OEE31342.1 hypothetical protein A1QO_13555 [Vibrio genomosp. F10 str. ZF-129]